MLAREEQKAAEAADEEYPTIAAVNSAFVGKKPQILQDALNFLKENVTDLEERKAFLNEKEGKLGNTALHTCFMLYAEENIRIINSVSEGKKSKPEIKSEGAEALILASKIAGILVAEGCDTTLTNFAGKTALQNILQVEGVFPNLIYEGMSRFANIDIRNMLTVSEKSQYFTTQVANDNGSQQNGKKKGGCLVM